MGILSSKVAVITGSGQGIGKAMALRFAGEGADVVVSDVVPETMNTVAQEIKSMGRRSLPIKADVSNKKDVEKLAAAAIKKFKKVDILVNNAGIVRHAPILEMSEEDWDTVIDVDLKGVFLCSQAFARHMVQRKHGRIINISSIAGIGGSKRVSVNYAAAKAGVIALTKRFARELGKYGIAVNAIAPGFIVTDIGKAGKTQEQYKAHVRYCKKATVLDKVGQVEDIAATAAFLASDEAAFISGTVISVDGGRTDKL